MNVLKKKVGLHFLTLVLTVCIFFTLTGCTVFWEYEKTYSSSFLYNNLIKYQFQDLNKDFSGPIYDIPDEAYTHASAWFRDVYGEDAGNMRVANLLWYDKFSANEELYYFYQMKTHNRKDASLIYKNDTLIASYESITEGALIKDNFLYYHTGGKYHGIDVFTGQTAEITKEQFDTEYFKIEPPLIELPENGKYKNHTRLENLNTIENPLLDIIYKNERGYGSSTSIGTDWFYEKNNIWYNLYGSVWFSYNNEYYLIEYATGGSILCKFDFENKIYTKIARMGISSEGYILHQDYIYYHYGKNTRNRYVFFSPGWITGHPDSIYQKQMNYARISLVTFENEPIKEKDYLNLSNPK